MHASTDAVGRSCAISTARLGPVSTTTRSGSMCPTRETTSLIRRPVPISTPLASEITGTDAGNRVAEDGQVLPHRLAGHAERHRIDAIQRLVDIGGGPQVVGQHDTGQIGLVRAS